MRVLDPTLQAAMDSGNFSPIVRAAVLDPDTHAVTEYLNLVYYKINGISIEIEFYDPSGGFSDTVSLERGALINGIEYTIFSGIYYLANKFKIKGGAYGLYHATGALIQPAAVNVIADISYSSVIMEVLAVNGECTLAMKNPMNDWQAYEFLPTGSYFHTSNIFTFFPLLRQKYLIYATENGIGSLLFYAVSDVLNMAAEYTLTMTAQDSFSIKNNFRQFVWKDEAGTLHQPGPAGYPIHNLGWIFSSYDPPDVPDNNLVCEDAVMTVIPNLKYQSGDCVKFDPGIGGYTPVNSVLDVTEVFDTRQGGSWGNPDVNKNIIWRMELRPLRYFAHTEGGAVDPATDYGVAYEPLSTSGFNKLLDHHVTNVQMLADAVDNLPVSRTDTTNTFRRGQYINGTVDEIQLRIQAVAGQTALLQSWENQYGTYQAKIGPTGFFQVGTIGPLNNGAATLQFTKSDGATVIMNIDSSNARVGIGTTSPTQKLEVNGGGMLVTSTGFNPVSVRRFSNDANGQGLRYIKGRGTPDSPSGCLSGDQMARFMAVGYLDDGTLPTAASVEDFVAVYAAENQTSTHKGRYTIFKTVPIGSASSAEIMRIDSTGCVGIGVTSPGAKLQVSTGATGMMGLMVKGYSGQTENLFQVQDSSDNILVKIQADGTLFPVQAATASAPTYVKGALYFDTTLKKLRVGGATAWETITST